MFNQLVLGHAGLSEERLHLLHVLAGIAGATGTTSTLLPETRASRHCRRCYTVRCLRTSSLGGRCCQLVRRTRRWGLLLLLLLL
jgi:hypothetical protein